MIELIILGIVLFIVGVSATFLYDKYAAEKARKQELDRAAPPKPIPAPRKSKTKNLSQDLEEEFYDSFKAHIESQAKPKAKPKVKRTIKPGSIKVGIHNSNQLPEETQYLEELFEDVSTKSTLTVQELIDKIEKMKKKL